MKKRIVSALLALVLILSNFTGGGLIEHVHVEAAGESLSAMIVVQGNKSGYTNYGWTEVKIGETKELTFTPSEDNKNYDFGESDGFNNFGFEVGRNSGFIPFETEGKAVGDMGDMAKVVYTYGDITIKAAGYQDVVIKGGICETVWRPRFEGWGTSHVADSVNLYEAAKTQLDIKDFETFKTYYRAIESISTSLTFNKVELVSDLNEEDWVTIDGIDADSVEGIWGNPVTNENGITSFDGGAAGWRNNDRIPVNAYDYVKLVFTNTKQFDQFVVEYENGHPSETYPATHKTDGSETEYVLSIDQDAKVTNIFAQSWSGASTFQLKEIKFHKSSGKAVYYPFDLPLNINGQELVTQTITGPGKYTYEFERTDEKVGNDWVMIKKGAGNDADHDVLPAGTVIRTTELIVDGINVTFNGGEPTYDYIVPSDGRVEMMYRNIYAQDQAIKVDNLPATFNKLSVTIIVEPDKYEEPVPKPVAPEGYEIVYELDLTDKNIEPNWQGISGDNAAIAAALQKDGAYVEFITCYPGATAGWIKIELEDGTQLEYNSYDSEIRSVIDKTDRTSIVRLPNEAVLDAIKQAQEKGTAIKGISLVSTGYSPDDEPKARESKSLGLFIYAKIPGDTPDLPTCEGHDDTWVVNDAPEKSEDEGTRFKIKLNEGDKIYNGDTLELHILGTADVEGKSNPGIRLYVASGNGYISNNLTGSYEHVAGIQIGTFEFDAKFVIDAATGNPSNPEAVKYIGDSIVFNINDGGYNSAEITHFAYKITHHEHTALEGTYKPVEGGDTQHTYECSICHQTITENHTPGAEYGSDENGHWNKCDKCGGKVGSTAVPHDDLKYTPNSDNKTHTVECKTCGYKNESEEHVESKNKYDEDDVGRYHVCEYCDARLDVTEHHYVFVDDKNGTTHHEECKTCHHIKTDSTAEHEYENGACKDCNYAHPEDAHEWGSWTPDFGGTTHTRTCSICGKEDTDPHNLPEKWTPSSEDETKHLKKCPDCGYEVTGEHNFGDSYEYVDAETHMQTCADCKKTVTSSHNYEEGKYSNSTTDHWQICKDCKGESDRENHKYVDGSDRCSVCNYWNHQHTMKWMDDGENHWEECTDPDCDYKTEKEPHVFDGSYDYNSTQHSRTCSVCHAKISEGHDLVDKYDDDFHWQECKVCDYETRATRHTLKTGSDENGHWEYCENCEYESDPVAHTPEKELGHDADSHWSICSECGEVYGKTAHTPSDELKHDSEGHWTVCSVCGYESTEKNEHTWDDGEITVEPTETTEGVKTYTCTECGETKTETVPKSAHKHVAGEEWKHDEKTHWHECVSETCDDKSAKLDEAAHTEDEGTVTKAATEAEEGVMTFKCTVCGAVTRTETIPKVKHTHVAGEEWKYDEKTHWHECVSETCDDKTAKLDEAAHTEDEGTVTKAATETEEGVKTFKCTVCGAVTRTEAIPKVEHTHVAGKEWKHDEKTHWHECVSETCDDKTAKLDEAEHVWDDGKVTVEPTYTKEGERLYTCEVCGETKTETVPVKGHEHSTVTKSDENGHWKECTICGETVGEVEAHTPGEWITDSEATSTEAGKRHKECTVCGYVTDVLEVPATGDIDVEVPTVGNVPKVELPAEQQEVLKNAIIDEEDVEAIESGASIDIELTVENAESTIAPEDKAVSDEAAVQGNYTHVRYLDINLTKVVTDASGASTSEEISELGKEVKIVITVPLALAKPTGRDFAVIRVHDGEATVLKDLDSDPKTVTISTNLFSSYTLVYVDTTPVPSTPGGMIGHVHVITGLQNDAHYHWRGCFLCSMRVDYEPHRFINGVCTVCGYRDPNYVPEVEEEEPAEEALDTEVTVVDAPAEGTEQGGDSEGTPEVTDTPANLPETEAEVVEVKEDDETSENPKTGVVFTGIGAVMAALAALVAKRK